MLQLLSAGCVECDAKENCESVDYRVCIGQALNRLSIMARSCGTLKIEYAPQTRHATWYGLSVSNTDFGLFSDNTAVSRCDTDLEQITEKQFMNMCSETKQFYRRHN